MTQPHFPPLSNGFRVLSASLLSALLIMMPFVQMAAATRRSGVRDQKSARGTSPTPREDSNAAAENVFVDPSLPGPVPVPLVGPVIVATKDDGLAAATTVAPSGTITYTVNINNNGTTSPADDATNVQFSDTIDAHTELVANSPVAAVSDRYNTIGNTQISVPDGTTDLLGNDFDPPGDNTGMTVTAYGATTGIEQTSMGTATPTAQGGTVTVQSNGSFTYDPPLGFEGPDTFKYRAADSGGFTAITTVRITIAGMIWYVNNNAGACPGAPCDGRLSHPFQTLPAFQAVNNGAGSNPAAGDSIFLYESATAYVGPVTLLNTQRLIGQDATASLASITGVTPPSGADPFPVMNTGAPAATITGSNANGINLGIDNRLRGFTVGNTGTGTKINGTSFGTLIVGNSGSPDVTLNGTGQALNLSTGVLSVTGGFVSVATTSSAGAGINLAGVTDDGVGPFSFGSTTVSGSTTQGILVGTTTADINFGTTAVGTASAGSGGSDAVSFSSNSSGTRTFGALTIQNSTGNGFRHASGGGAVNVTGATAITNPGTIGINVDASTTLVSFGNANVTQSGGTGVSFTNNANVNGDLTFADLDISPDANQAALVATTNVGTLTSTTGDISTTDANAINSTSSVLALALNSVTAANSGSAASGISLTSTTGTLSSSAGTITGGTNPAVLVSAGSVQVTYGGGITQADNAALLSVSNVNTSAINFNGNLSATNGTGLQFDNADGTYNFNATTALNGGDAGIDILNGSGGTFSFTSGTSITRANGVAGAAFNLANSDANVTYSGGMTLGTTTGNMVAIDNHDAGTITFQTGNLTKGSSTTQGITISNCGGGTINFNNPTIAITMTSGKAVNLATNGGATINFTPAGGNGIDLTSTTATTFDATGGGTINVTGSSNTLSSTTGTALNVVNTTIGASDLTFQSISASGASSGIILNNTGSSGGLTVVGTGSAGSGGTIQNTTGDGISLTNTQDVVLARMIVNGADGHGINGSDLRGTNSLTDSTISNWDTTTATKDGIRLVNNNVNMTGFTVTRVTFTASGTDDSNDGVFMEAQGTASMALKVDDSDFTLLFGDGVQVNGLTGGTGTVQVTVLNSTFTNADPKDGLDPNGGSSGISLNPFGGIIFFADINGNTFQDVVRPQVNVGAIGITSGLTAQADITIRNNTLNGIGDLATGEGGRGITATIDGGHTELMIDNNNIDNLRSTSKFAISVNSTNNGAIVGDVDVTIQNNDIGQASTGGALWNNSTAPPNDGTAEAVFVTNQFGATMDALITNNIVDANGTLEIIRGRAAGTGIMNVTMTNNDVTDTVGTHIAELAVASGTVGGQPGATINSSFTGNTVPAGGVGVIRITEGASGTTAPDINVQQASSAAVSTANNNATVTASAGVDFGQPAPTLPTTPTLPSAPLLMAEGGVESLLNANSLVAQYVFSGLDDYQWLNNTATNTSANREPRAVTASLSQSELDSIVTAAFDRWTLSGLNSEQLNAMRQLRFEVGDLADSYLGEGHGNRIVVDRDAQGKGWFVDITAADDLEFSDRTSATRRYTNPFTSAAGRVDLLTAIEHEIGHKLGLTDSYAEKDRDSIMYGYLTVGERRLPAKGQAANAQAGSLAGTHFLKLKKAEVRKPKAVSRKNHAATSRAVTPVVSGEIVTANIGTLPAGGSVTITFQVTVDNPPNLTLLTPNPRVENQGTVTFNETGSPVLTDDPNAGGAADKTATLIDLFNTTTTLASNLNPSNSGENVTFTATVNETPAQTPNPTGTVDFIDTNNGNAVICNDVAVTAGSAQCITPALAAGTHDMQAVYSGDGNFEGSTSNTVSQVVVACVTNPVVDIVTDEDDADCVAGDCSLREAIKTVCSGTTITFDTLGAFSTPQSINLDIALPELSITRNMTIDAPDATGNYVKVNGNTTRVFNINPGKTVTMRDFTVANGDTSGVFPANAGGGIYNDHSVLTLINMTVESNGAALGGGVYNNGQGGTATLTITGSTFRGNSITTHGSAIYSDGTAAGTSIVVLNNSTLSGNEADGQGGGIYVVGSSSSTLTTTNSTITQNIADFNDTSASDNGGGIFVGSGPVVTLRNTIVAGNLRGLAAPVADDIQGSVDTSAASLNNLIGTGGSGGLTNSNGNQVGVADAGLGALANSGGLTQTHALLPTSPAVEAGDNTTATNAGLTTDQRGTGYPRIADSADLNATQTVDIGAFELHPSVEDITDKTTAEDTAVPQITFNLGDGTGALISTVTATSGNTTLVPNANLVIGGLGTTRTLDISPAANANSPADGTATITVTVTATNGRTAVDTFVVTVTEVNDAPVPTNDTVPDIGEDCSSGCTAGKYVIPFATLLANDTNKGAANESGQTLNITAVSSPTGGTVAINGTDVEFTPTANFFGPAGFTYTVTDNGTTNTVLDAKTGNATVSFNITAVNDDPTLATNTGITVNEGSLGNIITSAMLSTSDVDNTPAQLTYTVGTAPVNGTLRKSGGALASGGTFTQADIDGNLITYDHDGSETTADSFTFTVSDGTASIGPFTFNITITAVNNAPAVTAGGTLNYTENDVATAIDTTITVSDPDSPNLASATAQITGNYVNGEDILSFNNTATITGIFNPGSGTLTLTGSDTVANYQAALRAVKYNNTSENPSTSARTVSWIVNDGSLSSSAVTSTINVTSVNEAPVNTVPGPQGTNQNTAVVFSSGNGNQISVADADAGTNVIQVTLNATNGTLTLSGTTGLSFAFADGNGTGAGDGTADTTMTFRGTLTDINNALNGLTFDPTPAFSGPASVQIISNDLGNTGSGGPLTDDDTVNIQVATEVKVNDASAPEPSTGSSNMLFTVTLSGPAPLAGASVNFTTQDEPPAVGKAVAGVCGNPGADYVTTPVTVNFAAGEQVKTISVPVCADAITEGSETFLVNLSSPVNLTIADGTAVGTITEGITAGTVLISELRTSGPLGAGDDFVEIYNNSNSAKDISGYGLFKMAAGDCNGTPVLIATVPGAPGSNTTVIPARGHYLFVGSAYSLADYGGIGAAAGNLTLSADIETDANVGLFSTSDVTGISSVNRLDAVGFGANTGGACDLLREGSTLPPIAANATIEHSYFRKMCDWLQGQGCTVPGIPKDTNINAADFWLADTAGLAITGRLGAPGPENLTSPIRRDNANNPGSGGIDVFLLDGTVGSAAGANRDRKGSDLDFPGSTFGTMTLRYRVTNNTGVPVTRLRYRVVDISTTIQPAGPTADLRALTGIDEDIPPGNDPPVGPVNDSTTCTSQGFATPCTVTVNKTTLETPWSPPALSIGGGYNSTLSSDTVTITPLPNGQSILINFKLGVEKTGQFRFYIIVEALP